MTTNPTQLLENSLPERYGTVSSVAVLSEKTGESGEAAEAVYKVQLTERSADRPIYVREVSQERIAPVRRALAIDKDIGIPDSELIESNRPLLVMEPARGRPLSVLLPLFLLPGCWLYSRTGLLEATASVGRYFGRLHSETEQDVAVPTDFPRFEKYTRYSENLYSRLDDTLVSAVDQTISRLQDTETPVSCIFSDPTPHNLFYADRNIELIDYTFYDNLSVKDLVAFERGVELMAGRLPYGRESQATALVEAFRAGYEETGPDLYLGDVYECFKVVDYCHVLNRYLDGSLGGPNSPLTQKITSKTDVRVCLSKLEQLV